MISAHDTILFQGDSITDAGRSRENLNPNVIQALAAGYAGVVASGMLADRPADGLKFFNRGISGNRVTDLLARWRSDALLLQPDVLSILIGVNDTWHKFGSNTGTSLGLYEKTYRLLLETTREDLPAVRLVLCEPFSFAVGAFQQEWCDEVKQRSEIVQKLVSEFDAVFVPFQDLFDQLRCEAPAEYWLPDGVHPSPGGHARMAAFWRAKVEA